MEQQQYDVFISYSRKDTNIVNKICKAFDDNGITYFIDRQGIGGGLEFPKILAEAILSSQIFLFIASRNAYNSRFTQSEVVFAFNRKQKSDIIPYFIDDSRFPPELELTFAAINWRRMENHPIETTLVNDVLKRVGKTRLVEAEEPIQINGLYKKYKSIIISSCLLFILGLALFITRNKDSAQPIDNKLAQSDSVNTTIIVSVTDSLITQPTTLGDLPYTYSGPIDENQMPHGKGMAKYQDDNGTCEGTFNHGILEGDALQSLANGDTFKGNIKNNEYEEGEYLWKDGEKYIGTFKNGKPYSGTYYNASKSIEGVYDKGQYKMTN